MFFSKKLKKFKNIKHCFFSRKNGVSKGIYESLNCGIGSKDELLKAIKLGYDGVQMGTRFIATTECNTHEDYKDAIVQASENDIAATTRLTGVPISVIKSNNYQKENSWLFQKLLNSRFKHRARMILNLKSFIRLKYLTKKNSAA